MTEQKEEQEVSAVSEVSPEDSLKQEKAASAIEQQESSSQEVSAVSSENRSRVFIVIGRDKDMNEAVLNAVANLGFESIVLGSSQEETKNIVDNPESYADVTFAVAVLSGDDVATPREEFPKNALLQPESEAIFLLGLLTARLTPQGIFSLFQAKQNFKKPFQHALLSYVPYDKANRWQFDLLRALKAAGYEVDANKLL